MKGNAIKVPSESISVRSTALIYNGRNRNSAERAKKYPKDAIQIDQADTEPISETVGLFSITRLCFKEIFVEKNILAYYFSRHDFIQFKSIHPPMLLWGVPIENQPNY